MWRLVLAAIVVSGLTFAGALPAVALDYEEPVVPSGFMLVAQPAAPTIASVESTIFFRLALEDLDTVTVSSPTGSGVTWFRAGMPGDGAAIPGDQWSEEGGRAVWNWGR